MKRKENNNNKIFRSEVTHSPVTIIAKLDNYNFILRKENRMCFSYSNFG